MSKHNHNNPEKPQAEAPEAEIPESMEKMPEADAEEAAEEANEEMQRIEALQQQLNDARAAVEKEKKEYLFLMADFDNFRKRVVKEKAEILRNGAEKVLAGLLPIVDDFERGLEATAGTDNAEGVREGMELIYNKLVKHARSHRHRARRIRRAEGQGARHRAEGLHDKRQSAAPRQGGRRRIILPIWINAITTRCSASTATPMPTP